MASRRSRAIGLGIVASMILVLGTVAGGLVVIRHDGGIIDEWYCSQGERPIYYAEGGSDCLAAGRALPTGAHLDPLGNRPLRCDGRWGWVEIEPLGTTRTRPDQGDRDCIRSDTPIPRGWEATGR